MTDQVLVTSNMFYLAILSLYLFCRQPNPPNISANLKTLKLYGLSCGIVPIQVCGKKTTSSVYAESFEIFTFASVGVLVAVPHPVVDAAGVVRQLVPAQPPAPPAPPHVRHPWW